MATKILMPKLSDTMTEGLILKWLKKEGDKVKQGEILVEIESDKADMELEAYDSGILRKIIIPEGGKAPIGAPIAIIAEADEDITSLLSEAPQEPKPTPQKQAIQEPKSSETLKPSTPQIKDQAEKDDRIKASPLAKKIAAEKEIDLRSIKGSGPGGRIIKRDVIDLEPQTTVVSTASYNDIDLSLIRKTIAKRMTESKQMVPHFYVTMEIDMEPAIAFREQINSTLNAKYSFTDILIKASAVTLLRHPAINASYLGNQARQYREAHIAVAVALDDGLVTPVIRNCESKSLSQINTELRDLVERARNRKLKPEEYQGATFTISNLGMFGVEDFVAIINPPEGAILAVGAIIEKPVVRKGTIIIGHTMKVTLSSDHRIIDGATAAKFLQDLKAVLEAPLSMLV